jgi:hypothetical protein
MDKNNIKQMLSKTFISEDKVPGVTVTKNAQTDSGKDSKNYYKDVANKMGEYDKASKKEVKDAIEPVKQNYEGKDEEEYHAQMEIMNGQEMIEYDRTVNKTFSDRAEEAIAGSSKMGNNPEWANVIPEQPGFTGPDFGKNLVKNIKASEKKRKEQTQSHKFFGDFPYEARPFDKNYAMESENKKETMKRLKFKKPFNGVHNALNLIPETYKVDNKVFEMTDGDESYKIRWEGSLNEGSAVILQASSATLVSEDVQKMKHLMGYKSNETLGTLKGKERINEDKSFKTIWDKTKSLLTENDEDYELEDRKQKHGINPEIDTNELGLNMNEVSDTTTSSSEVRKNLKSTDMVGKLQSMNPAERKTFEDFVNLLGDYLALPGKQDIGKFKTFSEKLINHMNDVISQKGDTSATNEGEACNECGDNPVMENDRFNEIFDGYGDEELDSDWSPNSNAIIGEFVEYNGRYYKIIGNQWGDVTLEDVDTKETVEADFYDLNRVNPNEVGIEWAEDKDEFDIDFPPMQASMDGLFEEKNKELDEAFGDFLRSHESIFKRENKEEFERVKNLPKGDEKDRAFVELMNKAKAYAKDKDLESGARTSFFNEIRRMIYGGKFSGKQS